MPAVEQDGNLTEIPFASTDNQAWLPWESYLEKPRKDVGEGDPFASVTVCIAVIEYQTQARAGKSPAHHGGLGSACRVDCAEKEAVCLDEK